MDAEYVLRGFGTPWPTPQGLATHEIDVKWPKGTVARTVMPPGSAIRLGEESNEGTWRILDTVLYAPSPVNGPESLAYLVVRDGS